MNGDLALFESAGLPLLSFFGGTMHNQLRSVSV